MRPAPRALLLVLAVLAASLAVPVSVAHAEPPETTHRLYYMSNLNYAYSYGIYTSDLDGSNERALLSATTGRSVDSLVASPDGSQLAYIFYQEFGPSSVRVMNADGSNVRVLLPVPAKGFGRISWTPDSTSILYYEIAAHPGVVRIVNVNTGAVTRVPNSDDVLAPVIDRANPTQIVGHRSGGPLVTMPLDGSTTPVPVPGSPPLVATPAVAADGTIVFVNILDQDRYITDLAKLKDGVLTTMVHGGDSSARPYISPDGVNVVFDRFEDAAHKYVGDPWTIPLDLSVGASRLFTTGFDEFSPSDGYVDSVGPTGVVSNVTAALNGTSAALRWTMPADPDATDVVMVRSLGSTPGGGVVVEAGSRQPFVDTGLTVGGIYTYVLYTRDRFGNRASTGTTFRLRAMNPAKVVVPQPNAVASTGKQFKVSWGSVHAPAGTTYTVLWNIRTYDPNDPPPLQPWLTDTTETSAVFGLNNVPFPPAQGDRYGIVATAKDQFGNSTVPSSAIGVVAYDQTAGSYSTGWRVPAAGGRYFGSVAAAARANLRVDVFLTGSTYVIIGDRCPTCGQMRVLVDGRLRNTVDTYARSWQFRQVLWRGTIGYDAPRRITLINVGTPGRPNLDLDAFAGLP